MDKGTAYRIGERVHYLFNKRKNTILKKRIFLDRMQKTPSVPRAILISLWLLRM